MYQFSFEIRLLFIVLIFMASCNENFTNYLKAYLKNHDYGGLKCDRACLWKLRKNVSRLVDMIRDIFLRSKHAFIKCRNKLL